MQRSQFRILHREFLLLMFDVEMFSAQARGDSTSLLGQIATVLVCLSILLAAPVIAFDGNMSGPEFIIGAWSFQYFLISTTMVIIGLFAVLNWNATFPEKRDVQVLAPLPVRPRTIFLARISAVATALSIAVLALHVLAGLLWPFVFNKTMPAQEMPAFTFDEALPPLEANQLKPVLDRDLQPLLRNGGLASGTGGGLAIGVYRHGTRQIMAYGTAKTDSLFEIGSISKTFTGLLLAQMVEEKRVALDEPLRLLLPPETVSQPHGEEIRLLDLATHLSGLPRMPNNLRTGDTTQQFVDYHPADLYSYLSKRGVRRPKVASLTYSNLGFSVLGLALANRAGTTYPELLRQEITAPLGLNDTVISLSLNQQSRLIQGHNDRHELVPSWNLDGFAPAGGIRSTAGDMLTYLVSQLHPTPTLAAAIRESHKPRAALAPGSSIGLAWIYEGGSGTYLHDGATAGYSSLAFFNPNTDSAGIVLLNNGPSVSTSVHAIGLHLYQRINGKPAFSLVTVTVPPSGGIIGLLRNFASYWFVMLLSGAFIYCCVLGLQGLAAQLPRRYFLQISSFLQFATFCGLITAYFLQPGIANSPLDADGHTAELLSWSPSIWFLGLYQQLNGSPALSAFANRAWIGLAIALSATILTYTLSYFRTLRLIVEEPDIQPKASRAIWLPPFGKPLENAILQFAVRTLFRSRQHRLILVFYAGLAFAIVALLMKTPDPTVTNPWQQVSLGLLTSTFVLTSFLIRGMRITFSLPLNLPANWIFRAAPKQAPSQCLIAYRRALWILAAGPIWLGAAALLLSLWPWRQALAHLIVLLAFAMLLVELCLLGNRKIPFACSWLPGKSNLHITSLLCSMMIFTVMIGAAKLEREALLSDLTSVAIATLALAAIAGALYCRNRHLSRSSDAEIRFEESASWQFTSLNLPRAAPPISENPQ